MKNISDLETHAMHCLVCGNALTPLSSSEPEDQHPNDAVVWYSKGNYGSTVYDDPSGLQSLEAYVCDPCMKERADRIFTARPVVPRPRRTEFRRGIHPDRDCYAPYQEAIAILRKLDTKSIACPLCQKEGEHDSTCDLGELIRFANGIWPKEPRSTG